LKEVNGNFKAIARSYAPLTLTLSPQRGERELFEIIARSKLMGNA
jgi:hypothetical protein